MLNKCGAEKKFFIVELCDDILVDTVVLASFEFSHPFFVISRCLSDQYSIKRNGWTDLSAFEEWNSRQAGLLDRELTRMGEIFEGGAFDPVRE